MGLGRMVRVRSWGMHRPYEGVCVCVFTKRTLANPLRLRQVDILDIRNMWQDGERLYHISSPVQLFRWLLFSPSSSLSCI